MWKGWEREERWRRITFTPWTIFPRVRGHTLVFFLLQWPLLSSLNKPLFSSYSLFGFIKDSILSPPVFYPAYFSWKHMPMPMVSASSSLLIRRKFVLSTDWIIANHLLVIPIGLFPRHLQHAQNRPHPPYIFFKKGFIYLFLEKGEGREKERERNINGVASHRCPTWGANLQPKHVPWLEIEPATLHFAGWCLTDWATPVIRAHLPFKGFIFVSSIPINGTTQ